MNDTLDTLDTQKISDEIAHFSTEIKTYLELEQWEQLAERLDQRQAYFEALFMHTNPLPERLKDVIKHVLAEDATLVARVATQKQNVENERLKLLRDRHAVKAYQ